MTKTRSSHLRPAVSETAPISEDRRILGARVRGSQVHAAGQCCRHGHARSVSGCAGGADQEESIMTATYLPQQAAARPVFSRTV